MCSCERRQAPRGNGCDGVLSAKSLAREERALVATVKLQLAGVGAVDPRIEHLVDDASAGSTHAS